MRLFFCFTELLLAYTFIVFIKFLRIPETLINIHTDKALLIVWLLSRFFYENIWREWDEDDDGEYCYAGRHLDTRIQLYYDIEEGNLSRDLVNNYRGRPLNLERDHSALPGKCQSKIQPAITALSSREFCQQPALCDNPGYECLA